MFSYKVSLAYMISRENNVETTPDRLLLTPIYANLRFIFQNSEMSTKIRVLIIKKVKHKTYQILPTTWCVTSNNNRCWPCLMQTKKRISLVTQVKILNLLYIMNLKSNACKMFYIKLFTLNALYNGYYSNSLVWNRFEKICLNVNLQDLWLISP